MVRDNLLPVESAIISDDASIPSATPNPPPNDHAVISSTIPDEQLLLNHAKDLTDQIESFRSEGSQANSESEDRLKHFQDSLETEYWQVMDGLDKQEAVYLRTVEDPTLKFTHLDGFRLDHFSSSLDSDPPDPFFEVERLEWALEQWNDSAMYNDTLPDLEDQLDKIFDWRRQRSTPVRLTELGLDRDHVKRLLDDLYQQNDGYRRIRDVAQRLARAWHELTPSATEGAHVLAFQSVPSEAPSGPQTDLAVGINDPSFSPALSFPDDAVLLARADDLVVRLEHNRESIWDIVDAHDQMTLLNSLEDDFKSIISDLDMREADYVRTISDPALQFAHLHYFHLEYWSELDASDPFDPSIEVQRLEAALQQWDDNDYYNDTIPELEKRLKEYFASKPGTSPVCLSDLGLDRHHIGMLLRDLYQHNAGYRSIRNAANRLINARRHLLSGTAPESPGSSVPSITSETEIGSQGGQMANGQQ